jgi:GxxExxY protein
LHREINTISYDIIGCAMKVHTELGPGLLESTYEVCLEKELLDLDYEVERQKALPVIYHDIKLNAGHRIDLLVDNEVIVELKSVEAILPVHKAQLLTYLKLSNKKLGLLIIFNLTKLKDGIHRFIL